MALEHFERCRRGDGVVRSSVRPLRRRRDSARASGVQNILGSHPFCQVLHDLAAADRSLTHEVPPTLEMQGVFWICVGASRRWRGGGVVVSKTRPTRVREVLLQDRADAEVRDVRARDGARLALDDVDDARRFFYSKATRAHDAPLQVPADPAVREEGLLVVLVREDGGHDRHHEHLEHEGRLVLRVARADRGHDRDALDVVFFHRGDDGGRACVDRVASTASRGNKTRREPSVSIVGPTSFVLPPSEMITPSTSPPSKTFSTSAASVTEPLYLRMNQNFTAPYASDACPIARCQFRAPDVDLCAALVLVELLVLDEVLLARRAKRREELRGIAAERAHGDAALQQLMRALSASQARRTEDSHGHLRHARRQGSDGGGSGGEQEQLHRCLITSTAGASTFSVSRKRHTANCKLSRLLMRQKCCQAGARVSSKGVC